MVDTGEILEVVGAVILFVRRGVAAEALDFRVMGTSGRRDLGVAVDDGAGDLLGREVEGIVVVEDDDAVEAVVLGDVRGRGRVLALHAAEDVRGGALLGVAKWVPLGSRYLAVELEADTGVERAGSAKLVEERAFEGDAVRDLYDALGSDLVNRAEGLLDPGAHGLRGVEAPRRRGDVENAVGEGAVLRGEVRDQGLEVRYLAFHCHPLHSLLSGGLQAGVEAFAVDHTLHVSLDPQFQARDLVGEAHGFGPLLAVEVGHEESRPEGVAGARDVRDLYFRQGSDALYVTFFRDGYYSARPRKDDGLRAQVVELSKHRLLESFLIHVDIEEAAGVLEGGLDDRYVGHYLGEDLPGFDLVRPDARVVVGGEGDDLAEAATESHGPPDGEALGVSGEGEGRGVHDAGAGDDLLVHLAYGEVGVGAPVDLEVRDAYGAGNEGIGRRRLVRAAHGLGVDAMML